MKFEYPEIEVVKFACEDIMTASSTSEPSTDPLPTEENDLGWS